MIWSVLTLGVVAILVAAVVQVLPTKSDETTTE